ncbi:MAG: alanine--glyoxylate aminotransferase family protein [Dehalococcoidia bacterium]|nr:alanine--glyoxylate aminotransferase family protein [Dehalococcoidia bacterium]
MINHRGREFMGILERVTRRLKEFFLTQNDVFILTTSGTGAMETAVVNTLSPGDRVLVISIGAFGDRFANIAEAYGAEVSRLDYEWGKAADPEDVRRALAADPTIKAVLVTHNETSTGVTNPLEDIAKVVREFDKLLLVDAVSSLSAIPVRTDDWGLDFVATGSQKGWMVPPALAMVSVSPRAWEAHAKAKMPRFYFDITAAKSYLERGQTPWTPAVSVFYGLDLALDMMAQEGLENIFARHRRIGQFTRDGVKSLGLKLFADERFASDTVTAVKVPEGVDGKALQRLCEDEYDLIIAGGQAKLGGKIFRIGHLGFVSQEDVKAALDVLAKALPRVGFSAR